MFTAAYAIWGWQKALHATYAGSMSESYSGDTSWPEGDGGQEGFREVGFSTAKARQEPETKT